MDYQDGASKILTGFNDGNIGTFSFVMPDKKEI